MGLPGTGQIRAVVLFRGQLPVDVRGNNNCRLVQCLGPPGSSCALGALVGVVQRSSGLCQVHAQPDCKPLDVFVRARPKPVNSIQHLLGHVRSVGRKTFPPAAASQERSKESSTVSSPTYGSTSIPLALSRRRVRAWPWKFLSRAVAICTGRTRNSP